MQITPSLRVPKYRLHKPKGLGVVRLNGRDIYLGKYGTPESHAQYRRVIAEWIASHKTAPPVMAGASVPGGTAFTVNELTLTYLRFAETYYVKNGRPSGEIPNLKDAVKGLVLSHGHVPVAEFGPLALKAVREAMIASGLCRGVVNARVNRIRRMFKWGVENQLVAPSILHGLQAVSALKHGRCGVREAVPVTSVPDPLVDAVVKVAPPQIAAMIELQRFTGMRPGEVVQMRTCDIDTTGAIWEYVPTEHKTQHHGRKRVIHLGPQAQAILRQYLKSDLEAFIFSPREVMTDRFAVRRAERRTPMTPSQAARQPKSDPRRRHGCRYTGKSYGRAITYACDQAFPHPLLAVKRFCELSQEQQHDVREWQRQHRWSPNRLRHNAATHLRKQFGIEAARVVLGHSSAGVTEIYAEQDLSKAAEIMGRVG